MPRGAARPQDLDRQAAERARQPGCRLQRGEFADADHVRLTPADLASLGEDDQQEHLTEEEDARQHFEFPDQDLMYGVRLRFVQVKFGDENFNFLFILCNNNEVFKMNYIFYCIHGITTDRVDSTGDNFLLGSNYF